MSVDYQSYLASREWSLLREQVRERSRNECERCWVAPQQAVHHMTYENVGHETLDELLAVCNPCHEWLSGKSDRDPALVRLGAVQTFWGCNDLVDEVSGMRRREGAMACSIFAYSASVASAISTNWFLGYHAAADELIHSQWYGPADVVAVVGASSMKVAETHELAWADFVAELTMIVSGGWRFAPDARFNIYGAR